MFFFLKNDNLLNGGKFRKQITLFSFAPKKRTKYFYNSILSCSKSEWSPLAAKNQIQISRSWTIFWQKMGFTQIWNKKLFLSCFWNFPNFNNLSLFKKRNSPFRSNLWWILGQKEGWKIFAPSTLIRDMYKHNL